jgi:B-box zinc finger
VPSSNDETEGLQPRCWSHPEAPAIARCVSCGHLVCEDCRTLADNRNYCRSCAAPQQGQAQAKPSGGPFPDIEWKVHWAILIYLISFGGGLLAEYGIYYGFLKVPGQKLSIENAVFLLFAGSVVMYSLLLATTARL